MSSAEQADDAPILDLDVIAELRELGGDEEPSLVVELIGLFLRDAPTYMQEIVTGFEANDLERIQRASHTLKSSSANMGALELSGLARLIESTAKSGNLELLRELQAALGEVYEETAEALSGLQQ